MEVAIYMDFNSQPSRAVAAFCQLAKIPHHIVDTDVLSGQSHTREYAQLNPNRLVPTIKHGDVVLYESGAILAYLADRFPVAEHWFPKDVKVRARVNWYLHWHHGNLRLGCGTYFYRMFVKPRLSGRELPADYKAELEDLQMRSLKRLDAILSESKYVAGTLEPTIADIQCICELTQLFIIGKDYREYRNLARWMRDMWELEPIRKVHAKIIETFSLNPSL